MSRARARSTPALLQVAGLAAAALAGVAAGRRLARQPAASSTAAPLGDDVAHQLRNRLTALRLQVDVALAGAEGPTREALDRIAAQVDRFDDTITALCANLVRRRDGGMA